MNDVFSQRDRQTDYPSAGDVARLRGQFARMVRDNQFFAAYHHLVTPAFYSPAIRAMRDRALANVILNRAAA
jgi:hypothetical protein